MMLFLKNMLFTIVLPGTMGGWLPVYFATRFQEPIYVAGARHPAAAVPFAIGAAIYFWCLWNFAVKGRGTPAPIDAPKVLVVEGPYRYVRNPMYVGVALVIGGWAVWFWSDDVLWFLGVWLLFVQLFVLFYEEPTLKRLFGDSYERYCTAVRRWVPGRPCK